MITAEQESFEAWLGDLNTAIDDEPTQLVKSALWKAWQAAWLASRAATKEECAKVCEELESYWSAYKDTALLNGDIALSNAASGEPRGAEKCASAIRNLK